MFIGNQDSDTVAYNTLTPPITTRYIRFKPVEWYSHISMRIEIYGCPGIHNDDLLVLERAQNISRKLKVVKNIDVLREIIGRSSVHTNNEVSITPMKKSQIFTGGVWYSYDFC